MKLQLLGTVLGLCLISGCASREPYRSATGGTVAEHYPYNSPLTSLGAKFAVMPQAAQNTVRAETGTEEIADVVKESSGDRVYFKVYFKESENFPPMYVAPDGSLLYPDLTVAIPAPPEASGGPLVAVSVKDLPPNVAKVISDQAPKAEIAGITRENWGSHTVYVVSFKEEAHRPRLYVAEEGVVLYQAPK